MGVGVGLPSGDRGGLDHPGVAAGVIVAVIAAVVVGLVPQLERLDRVARQCGMRCPEGAVRAVAPDHRGDIRRIRRRIGRDRVLGRSRPTRRVVQQRQHVRAVLCGEQHVLVEVGEVEHCRAAARSRSTQSPRAATSSRSPREPGRVGPTCRSSRRPMRSNRLPSCASRRHCGASNGEWLCDGSCARHRCERAWCARRTFAVGHARRLLGFGAAEADAAHARAATSPSTAIRIDAVRRTTSRLVGRDRSVLDVGNRTGRPPNRGPGRIACPGVRQRWIGGRVVRDK